MNNVLVLLFSAGGAAFLTALIAGIKNLRTSRIDSEEVLITRLNNALTQSERAEDAQRRRAERAEKYADELRIEKDRALDRAATLKRRLIEAGIETEDEHE